MAAEAGGLELGHAVALLGAGVIAVPLFRKLGLGAILGYLIAGLVIGPWGFGVVTHPVTLLHVAEIGVVMFLFLIGLEMRPQRLWRMRGEIFGLGAAQVLACIFILTLAGMGFGFSLIVSFIAASGFVLSSTAVIMRMVEEGEGTGSESGRRAVAILLFEDLMIVPLLAIVALLGALAAGPDAQATPAWQAALTAVGAILALIFAGRYLLDPLFSILARTGAREVMTAAGLLVVLGAALAMQWGGLSMAMGAFLAGVLLSDSTYRHQLAADIEPFRGILLGLFFLSVGMSLDVSLVIDQWAFVLAAVAAAMAAKGAGIYVIARLFRASRSEAVRRAALFAQGGEFAFVLYSAGIAAGLLSAQENALFTAVVIISMVLTPLVVIIVDRLIPEATVSREGTEDADGLLGDVLFIGFGRFSQVVAQALLARDVSLSVIEKDVDMIRAAGRFGFKVYYGDGTRLDVLHASGAAEAEAIMICVDDAEEADRIVELCQAEFSAAKLFVRSYDRGHSMRLIRTGVDYEIRETLESAMAMGHAALVGLGYSKQDADEAIADVRRRDAERLALQVAGDITSGRSLFRKNVPTPEPEPLSKPRSEGKGINIDAADYLSEDDEEEVSETARS
mgnify:CR=1 FL=1